MTTFIDWAMSGWGPLIAVTLACKVVVFFGSLIFRYPR